MTYPNTQLFINGQWCDAEGGRTLPVFNPATGTEIGRLAHAGIPDLERAAQFYEKVFDLKRALAKRTGTGMPGPKQVAKQFARWEKVLK